jgi:hypothetical protein
MKYDQHIANIEALRKELAADPKHAFHADALTRCKTLTRSLNQAKAADAESQKAQAEVDNSLAEAAEALKATDTDTGTKRKK